jgi:hypothetical protein
MHHILKYILILGLPAVALAQVDRGSFMAVSQALVRIEAIQPNGETNVGTGVTLSATRVATNCHVTGNAEEIHVIKTGLSYPVSMQRLDWAHDVCILKLNNIPGPFVRLSTSLGLEQGASVVAIGFSGGYRLVFSQGQVRGLYLLDGGNVMKTSSVFGSGASGGGLFTENGELVGLLTYRLKGMGPQFFSIPVEWFAQHFADKDGFVAVGEGAAGAPLWQFALADQPIFMQISALQSAGRWHEMRVLASRWVVESNQAEAWLARGIAEAELGQWDAARQDQEKAVLLAPGLADGWLALARLYRATDEPSRFQEVRSKLVGLDQDLATQLDLTLPATH